tara:strand:- start:108 stop:782 length:675 start_codon:yes stop_codon:yes gene_type:complete
MILVSAAKAEDLGILNDSIREGDGNFIGYLGEEALVSYLRKPYFYITPERFPVDELYKTLPNGTYYCKRRDVVEYMSSDAGKEKFNHDFIWDSLQFEAKTKERTVDPKDHYPVSVAKTSEHQQPDYYAFLSITMDKDETLSRLDRVKSIWLCGIKKREDYFSQAEFIPKGSKEGNNNFKAHADMYNLPISNLHQVPPPNKIFTSLGKSKKNEFIFNVPNTEEMP